MSPSPVRVALVVVLLVLATAWRRPLMAQGAAFGIATRPTLPVATIDVRLAPDAQHGGARMLWFALGGAAAGALVCTVISNVSDSHDGFSTCTTRGYALFVLGGAGAGVGLALLTRGYR